ncbi:cellulose binding domain-containing protein [Sorangium sp. So ce131]|uniref:cellulose binding domain-containing protein n=1 Tax=Sorangium sp. So ce131 TaxID=3133282 RepID=UPI003F6327D9
MSSTTGGGVTSSTTGGGTTPALELQYAVKDASASTTNVSFKVRIRNTGTESLPLSDLTIRYWFTADGFTSPLQSECDFASVACANVTKTFSDTSGMYADHYLELGFTAAAGSITPGATGGHAEIRIFTQAYNNLMQANDYSFDAEMTDWTTSPRITVYHDGELAWGTEP